MPGASPVGETPPFRLITSPGLTEGTNLTAGIAVVSLGRTPAPQNPVSPIHRQPYNPLLPHLRK